jgi:hypothetical protein
MNQPWLNKTIADDVLSKVASDDFDKKVEEATQELSGKTLIQVQTETAWKWAARAVAAFKSNKKEDFHEYCHEAYEHAALASVELLTEVRKAIDARV